MRISSTQLPTYQELRKILASEASIEIPYEKENIHYADFSTIIELMKAFNLKTDIFTKDGWYKNEVGTKIFIKEFFGLRMGELLNTS